jgi:DNA polymerase III epsilon subunit-like protein
VNGYTAEGWRFAMSPGDGLRAFVEWLAPHRGRLLVGHNVGFDVRFIEQEGLRAGVDPGLMWWRRVDTCKVFDAARLGVKVRHEGGWASLPAIAQALGVPTDGAHGAMRDCEILLECLRRYGLEVETRPPDVVDAAGDAALRINKDSMGVSWAPLWGGAGAHEPKSDE